MAVQFFRPWSPPAQQDSVKAKNKTSVVVKAGTVESLTPTMDSFHSAYSCTGVARYEIRDSQGAKPSQEQRDPTLLVVKELDRWGRSLRDAVGGSLSGGLMRRLLSRELERAHEILYSPEYEEVRSCDDPYDGCDQIVAEALELMEAHEKERDRIAGLTCPRCTLPFLVGRSASVMTCRFQRSFKMHDQMLTIDYMAWVYFHPHARGGEESWRVPLRSGGVVLEDRGVPLVAD